MGRSYFYKERLLRLQKRYENARKKRGVTVAEFEKELGLPKYSVYPDRNGVSEDETGFYMYATAKEKHLTGMGVKPSRKDSVGVKPVPEPGLWGPTKLGGRQKEQGGHQWKRRKFYLGSSSLSE
jgi:hypothetical protein